MTLTAVWIGMGGSQHLAADLLKPVLEECGYRLLTISEWSSADIPWTRETWAKEMLKGDICIIPQPEGIRDAKSNNRLTQAMALGLPVIASPIPAYTEVIRQGENGYLASIHKLDEWRDALRALRDPNTRLRIGKAGRETAKAYSLDAIAQDWLKVFRGLEGPQAPQAQPIPEIKPVHESVDLIIATYNNLPYIKMCLQSIWLNTDSPYRIIVSDAGSSPEVWAYLQSLQGIVLLGSPGRRLNYSQAINAGVEAGTSKYFCVMNSDILVSKGWLKNMVAHMTRNRLACLGNLSNCNIDWTLPANEIAPIESNGTVLQLHAGMKIEQYAPHLEALNRFMAASNEQHKAVFHPREWIAAYCSLYARAAWEEVGGFDPIYQNGCEDWDHCYRLHKAGYNMGEAYDAFIFHAGGISRGHYQAENKAHYDREDAANHEIKRHKWAKKKIGIHTGPGWEPWNRATVDSGMGGSETWAAELAAEFSRRGHQIFLFGGAKDFEIDRDGVAYYPYQEFEDTIKYDWLDVLISSRSIEPIRLKNLHASIVYVMVHDVFIHRDPNHDLMDWRVNGYAYLSDWHKDFLLSHHKGINPEKMFLTHNGVDHGLYLESYKYNHDKLSDDRPVKKNQTVYSSSPDRGLLQLLQILPAIRQAVPDFKVLVAYGFNNIDVAIQNGNTQLAELKRALDPLMKQPGVEYLGRIDKKTLARHQMESNVWLYPTWFSETFCITAVENGLAGNAIVASDLAGLRTTVGDSGILIPWPGQYTKYYMEQFTVNAINILTGAGRSIMAGESHHKMKSYTWTAAADGWERRFGWRK